MFRRRCFGRRLQGLPRQNPPNAMGIFVNILKRTEIIFSAQFQKNLASGSEIFRGYEPTIGSFPAVKARRGRGWISTSSTQLCRQQILQDHHVSVASPTKPGAAMCDLVRDGRKRRTRPAILPCSALRWRQFNSGCCRSSTAPRRWRRAQQLAVSR